MVQWVCPVPWTTHTDISTEFNNKESAMAADLSNIGEANVLTTPDLPCQNQNKTEFIKDKYSLIFTDIDTKLELSVNESDNLLSMSITNMNKARLTSLLRTDKKNHYHFGKVLDAMITFWIPF
jgi:hypothetical protein